MYKYKGNKDFAVPTSKGVEGSGFVLSSPDAVLAGLSHVSGRPGMTHAFETSCCSDLTVRVRTKPAWHFGFSSCFRQ